MARSSLLVHASLLNVVLAGPCDLYAAAGTPCVAAHSTVRALFDAFSGPLYQVQRTDSSVADVSPLSAGGVADSSIQDRFCLQTACNISRIYDQTAMGNHLDPAPAGGNKRSPDNPVNATAHSLTVGGHKVYGALFVNPKESTGYRRDNTTGVATGNDPETLYFVTNGQIYNHGCT
jgi:hypothetical protein